MLTGKSKYYSLQEFEFHARCVTMHTSASTKRQQNNKNMPPDMMSDAAVPVCDRVEWGRTEKGGGSALSRLWSDLSASAQSESSSRRISASLKSTSDS